MKKNILLVAALLISGFTFAQAPQKMTYQAVVRDAGNSLVTSSAVGMQISILQGSSSGTAVYVETQSPTSNANGLVTIRIGEGTVVSGDMATIDWSTGPYFIKTESDPTGGTNYTITGTSELLSVPYALYAENSGTPGPAGPQGPAGANGIDGIDGIDGTDGIDGIDGNGILSTVDNMDGTFTINYTDGSTFTTSNLTGPAGAQGPAGPGVPAGGAAGQVLSKIDATDYNTQWINMPAAGITGTGTTNYMAKFTAATSVGNSLLQDNGTSLSVNIGPSTLYTMYINKTQLTATGDGQATLYGYRTRDSQNDGISYAIGSTNAGTMGYSYWGDLYSFGTIGYNYNDYTRCGGVLGSKQDGSYWGSLGYKNSGSVTYGVYGSNAYGSGAGLLPSSEVTGVGGGFFGNMIGSVSKGEVIGQLNSGQLFAAYNSGNTYTLGKNIELVQTGSETKAVYAVTSTEANIYAKGSAQVVNGEAFISFDSQYAALLGDNPEVTVTPKGNCNGFDIASISKDGFTVKELNNGTSTVTLSWIAVGTRIDNRMDAATAMVTAPEFDRNVQQVLFNDGIVEGKALGIWWDGQNIQFGELPEHLSKVVRSDR